MRARLAAAAAGVRRALSRRAASFRGGNSGGSPQQR
ncbi:hypothetical protein SAMN05216174_101695 [Actinokineospora iranica]|uniref:Uncharacterized protein n=1 Tax=Actinokineospora iranica TaxID=1271860 RepID=A0A1G6K3A1_9PSEU|nr:hypothetical protein SAMN05216174_101695 [Actinokineospora iranica]